jgi:hypothetical protein
VLTFPRYIELILNTHGMGQNKRLIHVHYLTVKPLVYIAIQNKKCPGLVSVWHVYAVRENMSCVTSSWCIAVAHVTALVACPNTQYNTGDVKNRKVRTGLLPVAQQVAISTGSVDCLSSWRRRV